MDLTKTPRGMPIRGARALAKYILDDEEAQPAVRSLPRDQFGFQIIAGELVGFSGWIDAALVERSSAGMRKRGPRKAA